MDKDRIMKVYDEDGNEKEMYILFTTSLEQYQKNYIFYTENNTEEERVYVSSYSDDGTLGPIDDEEEWNALNEVLNQFLKDNADSCDNCMGNCDSCEGNS